VSDVTCIQITQTYFQVKKTSDFTSQIHLQFMWAVGQQQTKKNFHTLSTHSTAMHKSQVSEPVSKKDCLMNPNQTSELIMDSDSSESLDNVVATGDEKYYEGVLLEPHQ
jgi:hypothetical protein